MPGHPGAVAFMGVFLLYRMDNRMDSKGWCQVEVVGHKIKIPLRIPKGDSVIGRINYQPRFCFKFSFNVN